MTCDSRDCPPKASVCFGRRAASTSPRQHHADQISHAGRAYGLIPSQRDGTVYVDPAVGMGLNGDESVGGRTVALAQSRSPRAGAIRTAA